MNLGTYNIPIFPVTSRQSRSELKGPSCNLNPTRILKSVDFLLTGDHKWCKMDPRSAFWEHIITAFWRFADLRMSNRFEILVYGSTRKLWSPLTKQNMEYCFADANKEQDQIPWHSIENELSSSVLQIFTPPNFYRKNRRVTIMIGYGLVRTGHYLTMKT